jgi:hypothetical protein
MQQHHYSADAPEAAKVAAAKVAAGKVAAAKVAEATACQERKWQHHD